MTHHRSPAGGAAEHENAEVPHPPVGVRDLRAERLDLAARLVSRAPDITRLLDKLERRGLVARDRPADNRRVVRVGITAAGIDLLDRLREPVRDCHARQLGHLPRKDLEALVALLQAARLPHEDPDSTWR